MIDHPDPVSLLEAMAATLDNHVVTATEGGVQHQARVVANLCRILARHFSSDETTTAQELANRLGIDGDLEALVAELDRQIADGTVDGDPLSLLLADAARRAEIAKPGYTDG